MAEEFTYKRDAGRTYLTMLWNSNGFVLLLR